MDPNPHPPAAARERLAAQLPRLRRVARALACDPQRSDALVAATVARALAGSGHEASLSMLAGCWRERGRLDGPAPGDEVDAAMSALPAEQRAAVALVLVAGLRHAEAAEMLDVPVDTLAERLVRGREALAGALVA